MRQPDVRRKSGISFLMRQIVRDVREERTFRLETFDDLQGILNRRMRRMRTMPERVQKQNVQVAQLLH